MQDPQAKKPATFWLARQDRGRLTLFAILATLVEWVVRAADQSRLLSRGGGSNPAARLVREDSRPCQGQVSVTARSPACTGSRVAPPGGGLPARWHLRV